MCLDRIVRYSTPCALVWYTYGCSLCTHSYALWWFDCYSTSTSIFEPLLETFLEGVLDPQCTFKGTLGVSILGCFCRVLESFCFCFGLREFVSYWDKFGGLSFSSTEPTLFRLCIHSLYLWTLSKRGIFVDPKICLNFIFTLISSPILYLDIKS